MELRLAGSDVILFLQTLTGLEGEAALWDLEDAEGVAYVPVTSMALPHANPGLELDCRLLPDDVDL